MHGDRNISVVIPLYNKGPFVRECLDSVFSQSLAPFEVVVVDDGSEDGGGALVEALAGQAGYEGLRYLRQENAGVSAARNRGVGEAWGDFIAFLDADDLWDRDFLKTCQEALDEDSRREAVFGSIVELRHGKRRPFLPPGNNAVPVEDYCAWFIDHRGRGACSSSILVSRSAILACGGFPPGVQNGEDTDTWFRLSFVARMAHAPRAIAYYRRDDESGLSKRYRAVRPLVLDTLAVRASAPGLAPAARASAMRGVNYFREAYALALAQDGQVRRAAAALRKVNPVLPLTRAYIRALLGIVIRK